MADQGLTLLHPLGAASLTGRTYCPFRFQVRELNPLPHLQPRAGPREVPGVSFGEGHSVPIGVSVARHPGCDAGGRQPYEFLVTVG